MFKIHNGFSQVSFLNFFHNYNENNFYSLPSRPDFQISRINNTLKETESIRYFGTIFLLKYKVLKILKHLQQKSENGSRKTVQVDFAELHHHYSITMPFKNQEFQVKKKKIF